MWGRRRSAEEAPAAGAESAAPVGQPGSEASAGAPHDVASIVRSSAALNGAGRSGPEHAASPQTAPAPTQRAGSDRATGVPAAAAPGQAPQDPTAQEVAFAVTFTRIVSVLVRSVHYKHYSLSDLEWLVVPPLLAGQCAVMEASINGKQVPVAVALWASVSEEVDKRLSENLATPVKLRPDEWRSGDILWLIEAVGDAKAIPHLLKQVQETAFKGREARVRTLDAHFRSVVGSLNHCSVQS